MEEYTNFYEAKKEEFPERMTVDDLAAELQEIEVIANKSDPASSKQESPKQTKSVDMPEQKPEEKKTDIKSEDNTGAIPVQAK